MQLLNTYGMYAGREVLPGYDPLAQRQEAAAGRRTSSGALPGKSSCTTISLPHQQLAPSFKHTLLRLLVQHLLLVMAAYPPCVSKTAHNASAQRHQFAGHRTAVSGCECMTQCVVQISASG